MDRRGFLAGVAAAVGYVACPQTAKGAGESSFRLVVHDQPEDGTLWNVTETKVGYTETLCSRVLRYIRKVFEQPYLASGHLVFLVSKEAREEMMEFCKIFGDKFSEAAGVIGWRYENLHLMESIDGKPLGEDHRGSLCYISDFRGEKNVIYYDQLHAIRSGEYLKLEGAEVVPMSIRDE